MQDNPALLLDAISFRWTKAEPLCLDNVHLAAGAGESLFLFGPSGSGKSTLLALLSGVLVPERGIVRILGTSLNGLSARARDRFRVDHIGFIFQQFNLVPYLSVMENVLLPCHFSARRRQRALAGGGSLQAEASRLLRALDLAQSLDARSVATLSVGQQQRVAAARALIGQPEIIMADEPTSALDAERQKHFIDLLLQESRKTRATVLFISHDQRLAENFGHKVSMLDIGAPVQYGGAA